MIGVDLSFGLVGAGVAFSIKCILSASCLSVCSVWKGIKCFITNLPVGHLWRLLELGDVICRRIKQPDVHTVLLALFPGPTQLSITCSMKSGNKAIYDF